MKHRCSRSSEDSQSRNRERILGRDHLAVDFANHVEGVACAGAAGMERQRPRKHLVHDLLEVSGAKPREGSGRDELEFALLPSLVVVLGAERENFVGESACREDGASDAEKWGQRPSGTAKRLGIQPPRSGRRNRRKGRRCC